MPTAIEYTDETWNPIRARNKKTGGLGHFCEKTSPGCTGCYAERLQVRFKNNIKYNRAHRDEVEIFLDQKVLTRPLRWRKPRMIFPCDMTDLFADFVPDEWIDKIFAVMALCPQHTFQVLTKRAERMMTYFRDHFTRHKVGVHAKAFSGKEHPGGHGCDPDVCNIEYPLPNVWLGTSVEDQKRAYERSKHLRDLSVEGWTTWWSAEPLLGPVCIPNVCYHDDEHPSSCWLDWIVVGGESGPKARPMHPDWARSIRDQCAASGVPFFFKQWGAWAPGNESEEQRDGVLAIHRTDDDERIVFVGEDDEPMYRVGKKAAGRLLDGVEHNGMPEVSNAQG